MWRVPASSLPRFPRLQATLMQPHGTFVQLPRLLLAVIEIALSTTGARFPPERGGDVQAVPWVGSGELGFLCRMAVSLVKFTRPSIFGVSIRASVQTRMNIEQVSI